MQNILEAIEKKYPVKDILANGKQIWPYLRITYNFEYISKKALEKGERFSYTGLSLPEKLRRLTNIVYGIGNWFHRYDYVALSNTLERRNIKGKFYNKLIDPIIDEIGAEKVLYIETPAPSVYPIKKVHTKHVVCSDSLLLEAIMLKALTFRRVALTNSSTLKAIQEEFGLKLDDSRIIDDFESRRKVFKFCFQRVKPKAVLLSCYYGHLPAIRAARELGIRVIELQHGTIGQENPAYNVYNDIDKTCFPEYLLVFGRRELSTFNNSRFIEPDNVIPVGSFYIEYIRETHKPDSILTAQLRGYKKSVGVALESTTEKRVIEFVCECADLDKTILYLLIPRRPEEKHYDSLSLPSNVMVIKDKNFYELMMYVNFHSTVYSTCALEAPSLGVQNILMNIDGLSKQYYRDVLNDSRVTRYANTPTEFVNIVNDFDILDKKVIRKLNEDNIVTDYRENIKELVQKLSFLK
jgi:hypothetical protein